MILEPRFLREGYAVYDEMITVKVDGVKYETPKNPMNFTGVRSDAPQWAQDEYAAYAASQRQANAEGVKL